MMEIGEQGSRVSKPGKMRPGVQNIVYPLNLGYLLFVSFIDVSCDSHRPYFYYTISGNW